MPNRNKRAGGSEQEILAKRLGMSLSDFQSLMSPAAPDTPHRIGLPLGVFRRILLRSNTGRTQDGEKRHYAYFSNTKCEYFPCHPGADPENFNCLFCYCPFYVLGAECGGSFSFLPNGFKDCSDCLYPHLKENYDAITCRYAEIVAKMAED